MFKVYFRFFYFLLKKVVRIVIVQRIFIESVFVAKGVLVRVLIIAHGILNRVGLAVLFAAPDI